MKVVLPDNSKLELPDGATGLDAARAIGPKLAEQAVLVRVDGRVQDVRLPLADGDKIQFLTTRDKHDPDALAVLRHSSAHLLAEAVTQLYPGVKLAIGPPIENGFYYDFDFPEPLREEDLEKIQAEIDRELAEGREWVRQEISRDAAKQLFAADPYKVELVDTAEGDISIYTQGNFTDLCRGPHLQDSKPIKALKLTGLAGAYWRGDSANPQLTRIYGTAFYSSEDLDAYLESLEEARRRDHRRLGTELDLFHLSDVSPGSPFWHPKGMVIWNVLEDLRRRMNAKHGYLEVKTPLIYDKSVWETSGHWAKFRQNMFVIPEADRTYGIKPMNCPGHMLLFNSRLHSYRELPVRYAEAAPLHRNELAGTLHGLTRVRHITQDDAHIFVAEQQIEEEMDRVLAFVGELYGVFGLQPRAELSTRPDNRAGDDAQWDRAEAILERVLRTHEMDYEVGEGEGVFYGPKIDLHVTDSLGRSWQMATIQLDYHMPKQFGNTFMGEDNREHQIVVIHRAVMGAFERFIGILIEHYAGAFPFWLAPVQVRVLPVGDAHHGPAQTLALRLREAGFRADVGEPTETIGKRIRAAELEKVPVAVVYGDRESDESLAVRERGGEQSTLSLSDLLARLATL
ncbi:MAG: threonine--tRNA ligase [Gaiellaceae bacterium]|jgi:threonyl-tRNA synthetase